MVSRLVHCSLGVNLVVFAHSRSGVTTPKFPPPRQGPSKMCWLMRGKISLCWLLNGGVALSLLQGEGEHVAILSWLSSCLVQQWWHQHTKAVFSDEQNPSLSVVPFLWPCDGARIHFKSIFPKSFFLRVFLREQPMQHVVANSIGSIGNPRLFSRPP